LTSIAHRLSCSDLEEALCTNLSLIHPEIAQSVGGFASYESVDLAETVAAFIYVRMVISSLHDRLALFSFSVWTHQSLVPLALVVTEGKQTPASPRELVESSDTLVNFIRHHDSPTLPGLILCSPIFSFSLILLKTLHQLVSSCLDTAKRLVDNLPFQLIFTLHHGRVHLAASWLDHQNRRGAPVSCSPSHCWLKRRDHRSQKPRNH
jgi:hypothetical protein